MAEILDGRVVSKALESDIKEKVQSYFADKTPYVAIVFLGANAASRTYVAKKKKFGEAVGMQVEIFGQGEEFLSQDEHLAFYQKQDYDSVPKVLELIQYLNYDKNCVGIVVQLPLSEEFVADQAKILAAISPQKDIDGLGGIVQWRSQLGLIDFVPATPRAVMELLKFYDYDVYKGRTIAILGQSNLIGKPLANEFMKQGATVYTTNEFNDQSKIQAFCQQADFIISATGAVHLVDEKYVRADQTQVLVDVGYGYQDGKPVGDVNVPSIQNKVKAYSPVPGGVGPITVACLFANICSLFEQKL